ncbi:hypothetical protein CY34DRAFT_808290 [Suillus luteus UH-Slu-Lm8-n1]|uniref:Uncharacterized protein n=1 Tax=Suillus luteus UH-Slu-Lm8-n1 TaxID=930992 RepID=A0A0D0B6E0_9AGAM|nr:hypothetical protein CY34DRAFT_808290 [Suillus luteus UH-Slu-Lm8-n1]
MASGHEWPGHMKPAQLHAKVWRTRLGNVSEICLGMPGRKKSVCCLKPSRPPCRLHQPPSHIPPSVSTTITPIPSSVSACRRGSSHLGERAWQP